MEVTSPRLYVGNLDYEAQEHDLEDLFRGVGNVASAEIVTNPRTQQSKGFAFVEMSHIEEARRAVEVLHDKDFMGRKLLVTGAKSDGPREDEESGAQEEAASDESAPVSASEENTASV
ncbi:MAG: RNA-binding protein [Verrucomicrobiae bacterium]|nr:RNA-binding protein [Verrucomicrobiae bacterium]